MSNMKKEVSQPVMIGILVVLAILLVGGFIIANGGIGGQKPVSPKDLSPEELRDDEPPRRGQPGYKERIDDPATQ
jgi:hypothetical protein